MLSFCLVKGHILAPESGPKDAREGRALLHFVKRRLRQLSLDRPHTIIIPTASKVHSAVHDGVGDALDRMIHQSLLRSGLKPAYQREKADTEEIMAGLSDGMIWEVRVENRWLNETLLCPDSWMGSHLWVICPGSYCRRSAGSKFGFWMGPFQVAIESWMQKHIDLSGSRLVQEGEGRIRSSTRWLATVEDQLDLGIRFIERVFASLTIIVDVVNGLSFSNALSGLPDKPFVIEVPQGPRQFAVTWDLGRFPHDRFERAEQWLADRLGIQRRFMAPSIAQIVRVDGRGDAQTSGPKNRAVREGVLERVWTMRNSNPVLRSISGISRIDDTAGGDDRGQPFRIGISKAR